MKFIVSVKYELEVECKDKETAIKIASEHKPFIKGGGGGGNDGVYSYKNNDVFCILSCIKRRSVKSEKENR